MEVVMYIIMNKDVKMSKGKCVAQGAHVACKAVLAASMFDSESNIGKYFIEWLKGSYAKIVLKASVYEMKDLMSFQSNTYRWYQVIDEGRTEIPKGTLTAIAHLPWDKEIINKEYSQLANLGML